jgi:hypothetical protein
MDPRLQFAHRERLDQVVVGAFGEAAQLVFEGVACGQHQDRYAVAGLAQAAAQVQPVHPRQAEVEYDDVDIAAHRPRQPGYAIGAVIHLVATALEEVPDVGGDVVLVFDHQHAQAVAGGVGHGAAPYACIACHRRREDGLTIR